MKYENKKLVDEVCKEIDDLLASKRKLGDKHSLEVMFGRGYNGVTFLNHYVEQDDDFNKLAAKYHSDYLALIDIKLDAAHRKLADL